MRSAAAMSPNSGQTQWADQSQFRSAVLNSLVAPVRLVDRRLPSAAQQSSEVHPLARPGPSAVRRPSEVLK